MATQAKLRVRYCVVCLALAAMFALPILIAEANHFIADHHSGFGLHVDVQPSEYTVPALVQALGEHFAGGSAV